MKERELYNIGNFSKRVGVTPRGLRHYESIGLIDRPNRGSNGYRFYTLLHEKRIDKINYLKSLGFSLSEVREFLELEESFDVTLLKKGLKDKTVKLNLELSKIKKNLKAITDLEIALDKLDKCKPLSLGERRVIMENLKEEVISTLKLKKELKSRHLDFIEREAKMIDSKEKREFILAVKKCVEFAKLKGLKLGPGRGTANASIFLYSMGYSKRDPTEEELFPEYYLGKYPEIWFDVQYAGGDEFIQFCKEISKELVYGKIEAFKFPLLDIVDNTFIKIGRVIDFDKIDNNSNDILAPFKKADIERVFNFDAPVNALIYNAIDKLRFDWLGPKFPNEYLKKQKIHNFRDVMNIASIIHRSHTQYEQKLNEYVDRKNIYREYPFLPVVIREKLKSNFGMILYFEEIIDILNIVFGWDVPRGRSFFRALKRNRAEQVDLDVFQKCGELELLELLKNSASYTFNKSHMWGEMLFTKQTAYLKTKYKKEYYSAIDEWEDKHGLSWSEIGYISNGITLMQN